MSIAVEVEQFIGLELAPDIGPLEHDRDLLAEEVIDSLGIVQLITFLEGRYGITVDDDDLDPENFRSVDNIVSFVQSKGG